MKKLIALTILCLVLASCAVPPTIGTPAPTGNENIASPTSNAAPATGSTVAPVTATPQPVYKNDLAGKVPDFEHIIMIVLENRDYQEVIGSQSMPFLNNLAHENVLLSNFYGVTHPSLPNYIAMISGNTQDITKDCTDCFVNQTNLTDYIEASGRTWKTYQEDMPSPCYVGNAKPYYQKHNPFIYFDSIRLDQQRCQRSVVPLTNLDADLAAGQLPNYAFIMPNICNSGHDCPPEISDGWLKDMLGKLQASPALGKNSLIVVTFDEGGEKSTGTCCGLGKKGGGQIATILVSPLAKAGFQDSTAYSHYSLLKTILAAWNLPELAKTQMSGTNLIEAPWKQPIEAIGHSGSVAQASPAKPENVISNCSKSAPASNFYSLNLCLTDPADGSTLSGDVTVTAALQLSSPNTSQASIPVRGNVQRLVFYLDGVYLLSDYQDPYTFTLPSSQWVDGRHTLTVEAQMRDTFVSPQAGLTLNFSNGVVNGAAPTPASDNQFIPTTGSLPTNGAPFLVAAAGDGASGEANSARVSDLIASFNPNLFLYLGDVYEKGSPAEFFNWYGGDTGNFGRFRAITNPTIGNHEYLTDNAAGYFNYWNNIPNYYSYDVNGWHFVSLNSNAMRLAVGPDSAQYQWLAADLASHPQACTIVYYHHPLFNIGPEGATLEMSDIWKLMAQNGVSIVLNGHDHDYQRWQPLDGDGQPSPQGITEFVAGASGHGLQTVKTVDSRVAYSNDTNPAAFGALLLQLNPDGANFSYHDMDGAVLDSGVIPCVRRSPDEQPPTTPVNLAATATSAIRVDLNWPASRDNTGVAGYNIYRDGSLLTTVPGANLTIEGPEAFQGTGYTDHTVQPRTTYSYSVAAFDQAGNRSGLSAPVQVTTPEVATNQVFDAVADAYVNASAPDTNYGRAVLLRVDSTPDLHGYLRFAVNGLGGRQIASARLRIYANSGSIKGLRLYAVADNNWDELAFNYYNAPALGDLLTASEPFKAGEWITLDVTPYVSGEGLYSFGIGTQATTAISLASRESGINTPQLLIDLR
jgi:chitodextrinase